MEIDSNLLIGAIAGGLLGAIVAGLITLTVTRRTIQAESHREWRNYLAHQMDLLGAARAEFDQFLAEHSAELHVPGQSGDSPEYDLWKKQNIAEYSRIISNAVSACLATGDDELLRIAYTSPETDQQDTLTHYFVTVYGNIDQYDAWIHRNRDKLQEAIRRLANLIREETQKIDKQA